MLCFEKFFGHRSKTAHCAVFSLRSIPLIKFVAKTKEAHPSVPLFFLVDSRGIEPLSENLLI